MKTLLRLLVRWFFGFRAYNEAVLRTPGPVLLVPNHQSLLDWFFLGVCLEDDWKFVVSSVAAQTSWLHRKISINRRTFLIDNSSPYAVKRIAEYLEGGGRLVLFADGLRLDVAQELAQQLTAAGLAATPDWEWSAIPTVTATAKPAALRQTVAVVLRSVRLAEIHKARATVV